LENSYAQVICLFENSGTYSDQIVNDLDDLVKQLQLLTEMIIRGHDSEGLFQKGELWIFPGVAKKIFRGWAKSGEISFYPLETKITIFC